MSDPLAEVVSLLKPSAALSKQVVAAGAWRVRRTEVGQPFYCVVLDGSALLEAQDQPPLLLERGDFVLLPAAQQFTMSSVSPEPLEDSDPAHFVLRDGLLHVGDPQATPNARTLLGYCAFGSPDARLLVSLLPQQVHVRDQPRLATLVALVREESRAQRPAREVILARLLEVLLIEALRASADTGASPGLLRGLADPRLAQALRGLHAAPGHPWSVTELARTAALSRSAFFERFQRAVGVAPMEYLLSWRMALARDLLRHQGLGVAEVAQRVGYSSASTFTVAFTRHVGQPPARYARDTAHAA